MPRRRRSSRLRRRYRKSYTSGQLTRLARARKATFRRGKIIWGGYRWFSFRVRGRKHDVVLTPKQQRKLVLVRISKRRS